MREFPLWIHATDKIYSIQCQIPKLDTIESYAITHPPLESVLLETKELLANPLERKPAGNNSNLFKIFFN